MFATSNPNGGGEKEKPFFETYIDEIRAPGRYVIMATIVNVEENRIIVNDGTGDMIVQPPLSFDLTLLKEGAQVRVFGYVETEPIKTIEAKIIHNLSEVDIELYQRVRDLERSIFVE